MKKKSTAEESTAEFKKSREDKLGRKRKKKRRTLEIKDESEKCKIKLQPKADSVVF